MLICLMLRLSLALADLSLRATAMSINVDFVITKVKQLLTFYKSIFMLLLCGGDKEENKKVGSDKGGFVVFRGSPRGFGPMAESEGKVCIGPVSSIQESSS